MPLRGWTLEAQSSASRSGTQATADASLAFLESDFAKVGPTVRDVYLDLNAQAVSDATNIITNITRVTVKAAAQNLWDMPTGHFQALFGWMGKKAEWLGAQVYLDIPLHMWRGYGAPPNANLQVILTKNVTFATNQVPKVAMSLGWNRRDQAQGYTYCLSQKYGVPISSTPFSINPTQPGILQYIILPSLTGVTGMGFYDQSGQVALYSTKNALIQSQEIYSGAAYANPYTGAFVWKVPVERAVKAGVTRIDMYTDATWVDGEIGLVTMFENPALKKK